MHIFIYVLCFCIVGMHGGRAVAQKASPHLPVAVKVTATWCNVCGLSPWDSFKEIVEEYEDKAVIMAVHADEGSQLNSLAASLYGANLPDRFGQPQFYINEESIGVVDDWRWKGALESSIARLRTSTPVAASEIEYRMDDSTVHVETKITFNRGTNRAIHQALYLIEDHVKAFQNNRRPDELHRKVLRTHISDEPMGDLLSTVEIESGTSFEREYSISIDTAWRKENLEIVSILFEKVGDRYIFKNGSAALTPSTLTTIDRMEIEGAQLAILPSPVTDDAQVHIRLRNKLSRSSLSIVSSTSLFHYELHHGPMSGGDHFFNIGHLDLVPGIYLLVLKDGMHSSIQKFVAH